MKSDDFQIDIYNQYGLREGAKYSHCPLCSHTRSKKNQKVKCAKLDWDRRWGKCFHCGEVFQLHTYTKKKELKSYYAYQTMPNGRTKYWHDDGTTSEI